MKFRIWRFFAARPRLTLFLVGWMLGLGTGFGLAKGIIEIKLDKLWKSPASPTPIFQPAPQPTPKPAPEPAPIQQLRLPEPTLKSAEGIMKPNLHLGCRNATLTQTIQEKYIQQISLSQCPAGVLKIRCTSRKNPCGVAVRIGTNALRSSSSHPGTVEVTIRQALDIDVQLGIIASGYDTYTVSIKFFPQ